MSELLKSLEAHYTQGQFDQALELVKNSKGEWPIGQYHYNLGSLYAKLDEAGPARYHLEKALDEGFVNTAVLNNLDLIKAQISVRDLSTSSSYLDLLISWLLEQPSEFYLSLTLLFFLLLLMTFRLNALKKTWMRIVLIFLFVVPITVDKLYLAQLDTAVSLDRTSVKVGPSEVYEQKYELPAGAKIILGRSRDGWSLIKRPKELAGWVEDQSFSKL